jgi:hypothetical protein
MQNNVSPFYSSANNLQYFCLPSHMPMDTEISYGTTSYLANCSEPSYITPYVTNFSAPYATPDIHYSVEHLHNTYSRLSENSIGYQVASSDTVACDTPPKELQNFGNTQLSLPKNIERFEGRSSEEWADLYLKSCENLAKKLVEVRAMGANQQKKVDLVSTANSDKTMLDNTCAKLDQQKMIATSATTDLVQAGLNLGKAKSDTHAEFVKPVDTSFVEQEHGECETAVLDFSRCEGAFMLPYELCAKEIVEDQQKENIAEPSLVEEEHQSEEAHDQKKKEDKTLENQQDAGQAIVQVMQPSNSPNVFKVVQSASDKGRLIFTESPMTKVNINPFPIDAIDFENKKILIRSDQAESTKEKNVFIDDNAAPRMIKPKSPEIGVQKVDERKRKSAPMVMPTVKQLLDKYSSHNANNVFSRLGGTKRLRFPSLPGGHER